MKNKQETKTLYPTYPFKNVQSIRLKIENHENKEKTKLCLRIKPSRFSVHLIKTFFFLNSHCSYDQCQLSRLRRQLLKENQIQ